MRKLLEDQVAQLAIREQNLKTELQELEANREELAALWSLWAFYGLDQPDAQRYLTDNPGAAALPRQGSHVSDGLLRFRAGRYALGMEWFRTVTRWNTGPTSAEHMQQDLASGKLTLPAEAVREIESLAG